MMYENVGLQAALFLRALGFGCGLGGFYILLGAVRRGRKRWRWVLGDGIFWLLASPAIFSFFMRLNGGDVRGYLLFAVALGALVTAGGFFLLTAGRKMNKKHGSGAGEQKNFS